MGGVGGTWSPGPDSAALWMSVTAICVGTRVRNTLKSLQRISKVPRDRACSYPVCMFLPCGVGLAARVRIQRNIPTQLPCYTDGQTPPCSTSHGADA